MFLSFDKQCYKNGKAICKLLFAMRMHLYSLVVLIALSHVCRNYRKMDLPVMYKINRMEK